MTLVKGLVEDLFEDIADVTLIDEDTKTLPEAQRTHGLTP